MSRAPRTTTAAAVELHDEPLHAPQPQRSESDEAIARRMMQLLRAGADVRARKVRRLRAAVRVKAYENQLKLSIAVDRMLQRTLDQEVQESAA